MKWLIRSLVIIFFLVSWMVAILVSVNLKTDQRLQFEAIAVKKDVK